MRLKQLKVAADKPLSQWPIFYKDGLPFIYDDDELFFDKEGNRLSEHPRHSKLGIRLQSNLSWRYREQNCAISFALTFRAHFSLEEAAAADTGSERRRYIDITPDVAVVKGVQLPDEATYEVGVDGPPPEVVFEIGSPRTFKHDLGRKLRLYAEVVQAKEYFAYDPRARRLWKGPRLKAWRLVEGEYVELPRDERGWVWSEELESWLVEDERMLWLYDEDGNKRLTEAEHEQHRANQEQARANQEQARAEQEQRRADQEQARANQAEAFAKEAQSQVEQERIRAEQAEARLRELEARLQQIESKPEQT